MADPVRAEGWISNLLRAFDLWPYVCIAVSIAGFVYIAFRALHWSL